MPMDPMMTQQEQQQGGIGSSDSAAIAEGEPVRRTEVREGRETTGGGGERKEGDGWAGRAWSRCGRRQRRGRERRGRR